MMGTAFWHSGRSILGFACFTVLGTVAALWLSHTWLGDLGTMVVLAAVIVSVLLAVEERDSDGSSAGTVVGVGVERYQWAPLARILAERIERHEDIGPDGKVVRLLTLLAYVDPPRTTELYSALLRNPATAMAARSVLDSIMLSKRQRKALSPFLGALDGSAELAGCWARKEVEASSVVQSQVDADTFFLEFQRKLGTRFQFGIKRVLDILVSVLLLIPGSLVILIVWFMLRSEGTAPVFARIQRVGLHRRRFERISFATQPPATAVPPPLRFPGSRMDRIEWANDSVRISRLKNALIQTGCDLLPALWNVLKGDMSLVGPWAMYPSLPTFADEEYIRERLTMRPGMTGPAQVAAHRGRLTIQEWQALEQQYIRNWSLSKDLAVTGSALGVLSGVFLGWLKSGLRSLVMPREERREPTPQSIDKEVASVLTATSGRD